MMLTRLDMLYHTLLAFICSVIQLESQVHRNRKVTQEKEAETGLSQFVVRPSSRP